MQNSSITFRLHNLQLPFSSTWKYGILALAILLLLGALTILAYQICQLQKHSRTGKKKKYGSEDGVKMRAQNGLWGKKMPPLLLDSSQQSDVDMEACTSVLGKAESHMKSSAGGSEKPAVQFLGKLMTNSISSFTSTYSSFIQHLFNLRAGAMMAELGAGPEAPHPCLSCSITEDPSSDPSPLPISQGSLKFSLLYHKEQCELLVQHFDKYSRNATLGEVRVALSQLKASQNLFFCAELQKATKDVVGEVLLSLRCLPISQRMEVGLLKAKTYPPCSAAEKSIYARIDVSCRRHRQKHQKSRPQAHTSLIIFNETFLFPMPQAAAWDSSVLVSLYEVGPEPRHLIGQATVGRNTASKAADHWDLMAKSIQQPVAQWHPLLI
ncbi:synaptotagmin-1-like isoform X3 [Lagopus muta]|uniref:synaptotagmin-1-like isoform X3 n=1 Tax=Lagopus muta TaxID=64668 RepID=UPI00209FA102|nr:synaptotagmin-1-like isoform X3 [Lagopus muta]